ncbi:peptidase M50 [Catenulispora acidiphila DSM 44928]|uniref:Peptidase M50 n=1 Tax=Catenulispora acidiphila (strain DSM 44928 / JCM 14897 / NBRC 102108 / NRRL B-24433 / ID139908) TaxID=479433 RepID=C7QDZ7_CATAD|nr:site-2 protease family protein [Catenulispora acidiphila]ACU76585.1 peptidase M50 [Catenulispora acidiphila DSM 44928]
MGPLGIILFVIALVASIMLHEAGHMVSARKAGGKVTEYFVGFGPRIWSFRRGETEYGVKAIPAGGYVKIVGMTDLEPIEPEDEPRAFYHKPLGWRLLTLSAGSLVHFMIALLLLLLVPLTWGVRSQDLSGTVGNVTQCLKTTAGACAPGDAPSPARAAQLRNGDKIITVNGTHVTSWQDGPDSVTSLLHKGQPALGADNKPVSAPVPVEVTYVRDGQQHTTTITPSVGNISADPSKVQLGLMIGIQAPQLVWTHPGFANEVGNGFTTFGSFAKGSVTGLIDIPASIPKLFQATTSDKPRSADAPVGVVGMASLTGGVIQNSGYGGFLYYIASINMFIGIFNLLPLLPLDGGHIAIALYEAGRRKIAKAFGRPDPGRVDLNKLMPAAFTFLVLFVGLSLLLMAADITNPLKFPS